MAQTMKPRRVPLRKCTGCGEMKPKKELIRVVRSPQGEITLDFKGKAPGRGAYVCPKDECLKKALKTKALDRALETQIPEEITARLTQEMEARNEQSS